ncbi:MAG: lysophospholipid acyltransferase family protein [Arachnia sp.]
MTRRLPAWANVPAAEHSPRLTIVGDLWSLIRTRPGRRGSTPPGVPDPEPSGYRRLTWRELPVAAPLRGRWGWRLDYQISGRDALQGATLPVVIAVNEQSALDWQVLRPVLPQRLRATTLRPSRSLASGRSVVVFSEPSKSAPSGEFSGAAAELANQHNVPIVPVAMLGTFKLGEMLRLPLRVRPKVSVRFGAPIHVRGRSLREATDQLQSCVDEMLLSDEPTWWTLTRRLDAPVTVPATPRWRRMWDQSAPSTDQPPRIWQPG